MIIIDNGKNIKGGYRMNKEKLDKEKLDKEKSKEKTKENIKEEAVKIFIGKDVTVTLRGGTKLKGRLEITTRYELILTIDSKPVLVMKHAVDYIELLDQQIPRFA